VTVRLTAGANAWQAELGLPVQNPQPPAPWAAAAAVVPSGRVPGVAVFPLVLLVVLLVGGSLAYALLMFVLSRRLPRAGTRAAGAVDLRDRGRRPFFVFVLPCLNEERVIRATVEHLQAVPGRDHAVLVVDDDSDDATADIVGSLVGERVWLLRRTAPNARQGKGEALNAAVRELCRGDLLAGRRPEDVLLVVVDADGRLDRNALTEVVQLLADPAVGAVRAGVRINNRAGSLLARIQDMEFFFCTQVFRRARRHLGSVGMGGNGQFVRLSALLSLGPQPWSPRLTEDLDLGCACWPGAGAASSAPRSTSTSRV
ncbi:MAG TPA: glycosyltransferase, partial [Kineosporiaceae bacterium]|nr:glycosyltransferase [Kineosporiaceae bacterium]